jgi:tRNA 2-thiouridine synthesizing protein A
MQIDQEVDASGLACPMPIVKTKKALSGMNVGQVLKVKSTDPGSLTDLPLFAEQMGHELLQQSKEGDAYVFWLKKA